MKKFLLPALILSSVACTKVEPGYVGVIVSLNGDDKGVHEKVVGVGRYWIGFNEELHEFPTFTKTYPWTKDSTEGSRSDESISFQTKEGLVVNSDFGITVSVNPDKAATLFQKYRRNINEIIDSVLRSLVRDALLAEASRMGIEDVISSGKIDLMDRVNESVKNAVVDNGINVEKVYIIGEFRLPETIVQSLNAKIQATQDAIKAENQLRQTRAEADKMIMKATAEGESLLAKAKAEAKANDLLSRSLTPNLISKMYIEKWDGKLSTYAAGGSPVPFLNIGK